MNMTFRALFYKYYITEYENFSLKKEYTELHIIA